jgi:hypothetical protein
MEGKKDVGNELYLRLIDARAAFLEELKTQIAAAYSNAAGVRQSSSA